MQLISKYKTHIIFTVVILMLLKNFLPISETSSGVISIMFFVVAATAVMIDRYVKRKLMSKG
ncbi:hypothetical protein FZW96_07590 [Bacillus sp. BGMRC 2118]|nr:hypothetical protein FZW96_07590 [Bacillus sp. BGMRC 2118]